MSGALLVAVCLIAGWLLRTRAKLPDSSSTVLTRVVIDFALPCLTFRGVRALAARPRAGLWIPVASAWVAFLAALAMLAIIARARRWSRETTGALLVTATVGNTAFVGLPLIEGLFGREAIPSATLVDQGGSFVIVSTATVLLAASFAGKKSSPAAIAKKLVTFPPVVGSLVGLATSRWALPTALDQLVERIAGLVVPLALLSVGMRLRLDPPSLRRDAGAVLAGLLVKLVLSPLVALGFARALGLHGVELAVTVAQCAMAPMVTAGMVATEHELNPELASALVASGVFASLATVPMWTWALARAGL
ncbi:MAG: AEC family transporter [Polyangiales bacterium]